MSEKNEALWRQILIGVLIAVCSGSLGFGVSQATMGNEVRGHDKDIEALKTADESTNRRIDKVADMLAKVTEQNTELITLLRVQQTLNKP